MKKTGIALSLVFLFLFCGIVSAAAGEEMSLVTEYTADAHAKGIMFDLENLSDEDIIISSFGVNLTSLGAVEILLYYRIGSYKGYESDAAGWTLADSATVTALGKNSETPVPLSVQLSGGTLYGFYLVVNNLDEESYVRYTYNGFDESIYQDDNLKLTSGTAQNNPMFTQGLYYPRAFNGTIYYSFKPEEDVEEDAAMPQTSDSNGRRLWIWALAAVLAAGAGWLVIQKLRKR